MADVLVLPQSVELRAGGAAPASKRRGADPGRRLNPQILLGYHAGRVRYPALATATEPYVQAMAKWMHGRWRSQSLYEVEDVEQLLRVGVERYSRSYEFRCRPCLRRWRTADGYAAHRMLRHGDSPLRLRAAAPTIVAYVHYGTGRDAWDPLRREGKRLVRGAMVSLADAADSDRLLPPVDGVRAAEVRLVLDEARRALGARAEGLLDEVLRAWADNRLRDDAACDAIAGVRLAMQEAA